MQNPLPTIALASACLACLCLSVTVQGGVRLAWDASPTPGVTNYTLYASTNALASTNLPSALVKVSMGSNLTAHVEALTSGQWTFAVTAGKLGAESPPSNILPVEVPEAPTVLRTVTLQFTATVNGTNWSDVGFFRVRIEP